MSKKNNNNRTNKNKLWGGRFDHGPAEAMEELNASIHFDKRLADVDIEGSIAHAEMLAAKGIISKPDFSEIKKGLLQISAEIANGEFVFKTEHEDIHMNIEARLSDIIGDAAGRLHTARSRNDQVATDLRLWTRQSLDGIKLELKAFQKALLGLAEQHVTTLLPGTTHLQAAQPVSLAHHLLAYVEMAERDVGRLTDCRKRLNVSPLGAGALAGTSFPIDRDMTAKSLGFSAPMQNSIDAVSDRDFALEFMSALTISATHLSRLAEEIVIWSSQPYSYIVLDDAYSTGSSIMPQKRNPDGAELIRAKVGRVMGNLVTLLTVMKGLPLAYGKDLQEDKEAVFDSVDHFILSLKALTGMVATLSVNKTAMADATMKGHITATDLADWLVQNLNLPFRKAHEITGSLVGMAEQKKCELAKLSIDDLQSVEAGITDGIYDVLDPRRALNSRSSLGGTAPSAVEGQIKLWKEQLK
jgi:argininosuccinate lyase